MDFIAGLPKPQGHTVIFVVVDRFTKTTHFNLLKPGFTAKIVATVFMDSVIKLRGFCQGIVSNCDFIFLSSFWHQLMHSGGTKLHYSIAYHSQSDGQMEVVN